MSKLRMRMKCLASGALSLMVGTGMVRAAELPTAPTPQTTAQAPADHTVVPGRAVNSRPPSRWSDVVNPGTKVPVLTVKDKLLFPVHEEFSWTTPIPVLADAEYGVLTNADPKYGTNGAAWGKRVGAAALRQATTRVLTDGLLPIAFQEDPRYYRQETGTYSSRIVHALRRIYITQKDDGGTTFNYSDIVGRGIGAGLTQLYYPRRSRDAEVVFSTWGLSLAALGGGNLFEEFWPDVKHKLFGGR